LLPGLIIKTKQKNEEEEEEEEEEVNVKMTAYYVCSLMKQ
jgi:hypothetical protein